MDRKKLLKEIFDEKLNKEQIYDSIIMKVEENKKAKIRNNIIKFATLPVCAMLIMSFLLVKQNTNKNLANSGTQITENQEQNKNSDSIKINKIQTIGMARLDAKVEEITNGFNIPFFEVFEGIVVPKDLDKFNPYKLFIKGENSKEYNKLANYVYSYYNSETNRSINIAFSDTMKPLRDYRLEDIGNISTINGITLKIYQYEDLYMTEFNYQGYNFDIETANITQEELIELLKSLIK